MKHRHIYMTAAASVAAISGIQFWTSTATDRQQPDQDGIRHSGGGRSHASAVLSGVKRKMREDTSVSGGPERNLPLTVEPGIRTSVGDELTLPLVFRGSGAADSTLTLDQQLALRKIQEDFAAATSRAGHDLSTPEYRESWIKAKNDADSRLHLSLGRQGWLVYSQAQSQAEFSESHGTRIVPQSR